MQEYINFFSQHPWFSLLFFLPLIILISRVIIGFYVANKKRKALKQRLISSELEIQALNKKLGLNREALLENVGRLAVMLNDSTIDPNELISNLENKKKKDKNNPKGSDNT